MSHAIVPSGVTLRVSWMMAALGGVAILAAGCGPGRDRSAGGGASTVPLASATTGDWAFYRADVLGHSYVDQPLTAAEAQGFTVAWTYRDAGSDANPIVVGSTVYVTESDGTLVALDVATGQLRWSAPIGTTPIAPCNPFVGRPVGAAAVVGGAVFVPGGDGAVHAFDKDTGQRLWSTTAADVANDEFFWSSAFPLHGRIYVGVSTLFENICGPVPGRVVALDQVTGAVVGTWWVDPQRRPGGGVWTQPAYDATTNRLFLTTGQGQTGLDLASQPYAQAFVALDADSLQPLDALQPMSAPFVEDYDFGASPTLVDLPDGRHLIVAANKDGNVYAADRDHLSRGVVWSHTISLPGYSPDLGESTIVSAAYAHGSLFVGGGRTPDGFSGTVAALDPATGAARWVFHPDGFVLAALTVVGDLVVAQATHLPDRTGRLVLLDQATGQPLFQLSTPGALFAQATFAAGRLFVSDSSGVLYALRPPDPAPPPATGGGVDYGSGFTASGLQLNGSAVLSGTRLRLTSAYRQAGSAFFTSPVDVRSFTTDFSFQLTNAQADGITFTLQGVGASALGPLGGGLGYGPDVPSTARGIGRSVAVKLDLYNNAGEGTNSTGLYTGGASPSVPSVSLPATAVNLHSGHVFQVHLGYDGTTLAMTIADASTGGRADVSFPIDIPGTVGSTSAYVGFTGGTGGLSATQDILAWTYSPGGSSPPPPPPPPPPPAGGTLLFSDAFDRTQTGLGPSWTLRGDYRADGNAVSVAPDTPDRATATGAPPCADCRVQARVQPGTALEAGVFLRGAVATSNRYDLIVLRDGRLQLRRLNAGTPTVLAERTSAITDRSAFALLSLQATGSGPVALVGSLNGAAVLTVSDASAAAVTGAGLGGLWTYTGGIRFDDFALYSAP